MDPDVHTDIRGEFYRTWCEREFAVIRPDLRFVQMNHSVTHAAGTVRGLHYQAAPALEAKLIRCVRGAVWDVAVDLRRGSPTRLEWVGVELSGENRRQLFIPEGCAHGFQALTDDVEMIYCHTAFYTPESERGVRYDDPAVGVRWPRPVELVSERDRLLPRVGSDFQGVPV